jgi:hypothetical protein
MMIASTARISNIFVADMPKIYALTTRKAHISLKTVSLPSSSRVLAEREEGMSGPRAENIA